MVKNFNVCPRFFGSDLITKFRGPFGKGESSHICGIFLESQQLVDLRLLTHGFHECGRLNDLYTITNPLSRVTHEY